MYGRLKFVGCLAVPALLVVKVFRSTEFQWFSGGLSSRLSPVFPELVGELPG